LLEGEPLAREPRALVFTKPWIRFVALVIDSLESQNLKVRRVKDGVADKFNGQ
jgi:hypothetical protein